MDSEPKYQLVIWFDQKQASVNELFRFMNSGLSQNVDRKMGYSADGYLTLSLEGTLEAIDNSHSQVIEFIEKANWNLFRLRDTAGDEIRRRAYSELSIIEQELRAFINRGLIDVFSFDWWVSLGSVKIPGFDNTQPKNINHPLELMTIGELIGFVTFEGSEWKDESPILLRDLTTLVNDSNNFDEFRIKLAQKARKVSLWDLVFSKYLGDNAPLWHDIREKDLQFVIDLRNKVMHHRPVRLGELIVLGEKRKKIAFLFTSAKTQLSDDEKQEIVTLQKEVRDIFAQLVYERTLQNAYRRVYESLKRSKTITIVRGLVSEIDLLTTSGGVTPKEALELKAVAFDQLQDLTKYNLVETQDIILDELLPLCLHEDTDFVVQYRAFRNILCDWIDNHPQQEATILKNLVLDKLAGLLNTSQHKTACWTISTLGFTREDIIQQLLDYAVRNDNPDGDNTLSTLTWLSLSYDQHQTILHELHSRS